MNILSVIPLTRSKVADTLSYFTAADVPIGAIVSVPLRSKTIFAIVTDRRSVEDIKIEIKNAPYQIRKLTRVKATIFFPPAFISACKSLAEYYASNVGAVIDALISDTLLDNANDITPPLPPQASFIAPSSAAVPDETFAIQGDDPDRVSSWRSLIRQEFARKKSISFYVPTIEDARNTSASLEKGIEGYIFVLHGGLTKKKILDTWKNIAECAHPVVVIATGSFSLLPRSDIDVTVIDRENGRGWISQKHPYLDLRHALETIGRRRSQTVYLADSLLRTETLHRMDTNEIAKGSPFKWRSISDAVDLLVDMRKERVERGGHGEEGKSDSESASIPATAAPFRVLSPELARLIETNREESTHLFILTARRGLASTTVCADCDTIVACHECGRPVVLHTSADTGRNFFMCHNCGTRRSANEVCSYCGGWRLTPLGIGTERVEQEIQAAFPGADTFKLDADTATTEKQIADIMQKFRSRPGSILIGTEMALSHLSERVDHAAVASLDSLFALPDFRIQEKMMYALIRLRSLAARTLLVQTRRPEEKVWEYALKGNLSDFYRTTLSERKQFLYPPFSILIKISVEGKKDAIAKEMATIQTLIEPREIDIFPAFTTTARGTSVIHGLLKVEAGQWPDAELAAKLRSLPPGVNVRINPESLL